MAASHDGAESVPLLDAATITRLQRQVMQTATRGQLDDVTRLIWRAYAGNAENEKALAQLRTAIEARRAMVGRGDVR